MDVFDAAERYQEENRSLVILAGRDYGSGKRNNYVVACLSTTWLLILVILDVLTNFFDIFNRI